MTKLIALKCSTFHFDSDLINRLKTAAWTMQIQSREQVIKSPEVLFSLLKINMRDNLPEGVSPPYLDENNLGGFKLRVNKTYRKKK